MKDGVFESMNKWTFLILHRHISITEIRQHATLNYLSLRCDSLFSCDKQQPWLHSFNFCAERMAFLSVFFPLPPHYLFSDELSFSLFAGASCRSGRLAKSSCSARPMARERTTIFPSLNTQRTQTLTTEQHTHTYMHRRAHTYTTFILVRREVSCGLKENRKEQNESIKAEVSCRKLDKFSVILSKHASSHLNHVCRTVN